MERTPTSKADLLATAEAMLEIDNQERRLRAQHKRENRVMKTSFALALIVFALATLFIALHRSTPSHRDAANPPADTAQ